MSEEKLAGLEASLRPILLMLTKVGRFLILHTFFTYCAQLRVLANAIKNSSTILLPQWTAKLEELGLSVQMMPHDVSTRWNSTFDMLDFAIKYHTAIREWRGFLKPAGFAMGFSGVRVGVQNFVPQTNLYPWHRYHGLVPGAKYGIC